MHIKIDASFGHGDAVVFWEHGYHMVRGADDNYGRIS